MGMIGYFGTGPLWACVKVDDCFHPSSQGTLTHVESLENICWACFCHRLHVAFNSGLLFYFARMNRMMHCMLKWLHLINKIKMLILIPQLFQFSDHPL
jgi:hypothetical protein